MPSSAKRAHSRYAVARGFLLFWCFFIGLGAVGGALGMLIDPSGKSMGMDAMLPYFQVLPFAEVVFQDFTFSGWALLIVNGLSNLTAAALMLAKKRAGIRLGGAFGVTLMLWICIQFYMFEFNFMSTAYFIFGFAQAATGYAAWVFECQERFKADEADYPNIGTQSDLLVVYFSRMGYTKRAALEAANRSGAQLYEVKAKERTEGTAGFWWCGRYGMHAWPMPIESIGVDLRKVRHVTLCSPIWVFRLSAPMRAFCQAAKGQIGEADYVLTHHTRAGYANAAREMDRLLGLSGGKVTSICCKKGKFVSSVELGAGAASSC